MNTEHQEIALQLWLETLTPSSCAASADDAVAASLTATLLVYSYSSTSLLYDLCSISMSMSVLFCEYLIYISLY